MPVTDNYKIFKYTNPDGSFNYDYYRGMQIRANKRKIRQTWVLEENIQFLSDYIKRVIGIPKLGICHGTRRGNEQAWFKKYLGCDVIGTDISTYSAQFPDTIVWDFHEVKPEWLGDVDFIYSNSFDHAYDPKKAISAWISCLKDTGLCFIENSNKDGENGASWSDPFGVDVPTIVDLIGQWGEDKYSIKEIIDAPYRRGRTKYLKFLVIQPLKREKKL